MRLLKLCTTRVTGIGIDDGKVSVEWSPDGRLASPYRHSVYFPIFSFATLVVLVWALPVFLFWKIRDFIWLRLYSPFRQLHDDGEE